MTRGSHARRLGLAVLAALAAACGVGGEEMAEDEAAALAAMTEALAPEIDDAVSRVPWQVLGAGVAYKPLGAGPNALLVYGGYTALDEYSRRWASELFRARGEGLAIGHLYAVKGPNHSGYANREIQNSKLARHLAEEGRAANAASLLVIAHSSGTFVADELLDMLAAGTGGVPADTIAKVDLYNLDGGGVADAPLLRRLSSAWWVHACDPATARCSRNASSMRALGERFADLGGAVEVEARGSGCDPAHPGGLWCLHDAVITTRPHDPRSYDLRRDYTQFGGERAVVTSYLRP